MKAKKEYEVTFSKKYYDRDVRDYRYEITSDSVREKRFDIDVTIKNHWDSRVVNLSFTYRFNKGKGAEHRQNSAADEEQNRVKSGRG